MKTLFVFLLFVISSAADFQSTDTKPIKKKRSKLSSKGTLRDDSSGAVEIGVRGNDDLDLKCPLIPYTFQKHSTLRCESCKTLGRILHYAISDYHRDAEDFLISGPSQRGPELCVMASVVAELRQKTNGKRFWDLTRLMREGDRIEHSPYVDHDYDPLPNSDKSELRNKEIQRARAGAYGGAIEANDATDYPALTANDKAVSVNNRKVSYHTSEERETLPCSNYFLNRYCLSEYLGDDATMDAVEECVSVFRASRQAADKSRQLTAKRRQKQMQADGEDNIPSLFDLEEIERKKGRHVDEQRSSSFLTCLTGKICGTMIRKECDTRQLFEMQKFERDEFLRYEAEHGDASNPFVGMASDARKFERNPYAALRKGKAKLEGSADEL